MRNKKEDICGSAAVMWFIVNEFHHRVRRSMCRGPTSAEGGRGEKKKKSLHTDCFLSSGQQTVVNVQQVSLI